MLPGIDDGPREFETALAMARLAVADGISCTVCTPHIYPGVFDNSHESIRQAVESFRHALAGADIPLQLAYGADIQVRPDLVEGLSTGALPTLHGSRYFLLEPPHHVALPRLNELVHSTLLAGYIPVITHPERLSYIESDYALFIDAARRGAWIQLTGGALLGRFGARAKAFAERLLDDGVVHLLASDGHNTRNRAPQLAEARAAAAAIVGEEESWRLVTTRPENVMANLDPQAVRAPPGLLDGPPIDRVQRPRKSWLARLFS